MKEKNKVNEPVPVYDINNPAIYKDLSAKEVFEWLETTNEFVWKSLTAKERKERLQNKISSVQDLFSK